VETEEMVKTVAVTVKTVAVTVKMVAVTVKMVAVTVKMVAVTIKTAMMAEATETVAVVMTMAEKAVVDVTDGNSGSRQHIRGNTGS
jgi:hypothetical protein